VRASVSKRYVILFQCAYACFMYWLHIWFPQIHPLSSYVISVLQSCRSRRLSRMSSPNEMILSQGRGRLNDQLYSLRIMMINDTFHLFGEVWAQSRFPYIRLMWRGFRSVSSFPRKVPSEETTYILHIQLKPNRR
jgi:hypothetical protein